MESGGSICNQDAAAGFIKLNPENFRGGRPPPPRDREMKKPDRRARPATESREAPYAFLNCSQPQRNMRSVVSQPTQESVMLTP